MKKLIFTLLAMLTIAVQASAMSYEQARREALFLTDKMAYELNLTDAQYEAAYEINLDYLMSVTGRNNVFGMYWDQRNTDLRYILYSWQWDAYIAASYFYRPLYFDAGHWHFGIYLHYPRRDYFYFGRPHFYATYRGGHSWHTNGHRSYYEGRRDRIAPPMARDNHRGMRNGYDRGDYRGHGGSSTRVTGSQGQHTQGRDTGGSHGNAHPGGNGGSHGNANPGGNGGGHSDANHGANGGGGRDQGGSHSGTGATGHDQGGSHSGTGATGHDQGGSSATPSRSTSGRTGRSTAPSGTRSTSPASSSRSSSVGASRSSSAGSYRSSAGSYRSSSAGVSRSSSSAGMSRSNSAGMSRSSSAGATRSSSAGMSRSSSAGATRSSGTTRSSSGHSGGRSSGGSRGAGRR